ncbi:hypothetical protein BC831DRAFT_501194, partial [Entophlyctis helioformis]
KANTCLPLSALARTRPVTHCTRPRTPRPPRSACECRSTRTPTRTPQNRPLWTTSLTRSTSAPATESPRSLSLIASFSLLSPTPALSLSLFPDSSPPAPSSRSLIHSPSLRTRQSRHSRHSRHSLTRVSLSRSLSFTCFPRSSPPSPSARPRPPRLPPLPSAADPWPPAPPSVPPPVPVPRSSPTPTPALKPLPCPRPPPT